MSELGIIFVAVEQAKEFSKVWDIYLQFVFDSEVSLVIGTDVTYTTKDVWKCKTYKFSPIINDKFCRFGLQWQSGVLKARNDVIASFSMVSADFTRKSCVYESKSMKPNIAMLQWSEPWDHEINRKFLTSWFERWSSLWVAALVHWQSLQEKHLICMGMFGWK